MTTTTALPRPPPEPDVFYGQPIVPVAVFTIVLSTVFVGMRFWSRAVILRSVLLDDWLLFLAWIFAVATSACNIVQMEFGLGRQFGAVFREAIINYLKMGVALNIIYALALTFVKLSILCLYLRAINYGYIRLATKIILGIVLITHAWIIASLFTVCVPLDAYWDRSRERSYCHHFSVYWSHSGINISTDFLIFSLPLTVLHKLRIPRRQKIALYLVFMLAFFVCVVSLVRTFLFLNGVAIADKGTVVIACWTMVEVNVAVTCACLTTIKPLIGRLFPSMLSPPPSPGAEDVDGIETIGRAGRRRRRRDPLESDLTTTTIMTVITTSERGPEQSSTTVAELKTVERSEARAARGDIGAAPAEPSDAVHPQRSDEPRPRRELI